MKIQLLILLSVCLGISSFSLPVVAQEQDATELAAAAATSVLDEFMLQFNRRDLAAWAATLNYPHVRFASGTVTVWETAEDFAQATSQAFAVLARTGWDHSHWLSREVTLVSPLKVHIETVFQRFDSNNQPIGTYQSLYIVTNRDGHWGVQARSSLAP